MKFFSLYRVELRRLALSKFLWGIMILCLCAPLLGYSVFAMSYSEVMSGKYIANPVLAGTTIGAILWAVFTIAESDRQHRMGTDVLSDAIASPAILCAARAAALLSFSVITTILSSLLYLPYTADKMEYLFSIGFYMGNFFTFMMPTWFISILFAEAFYQITRRIELAVMLYAVLCYFSFSRFAKDDYFSRWLNPLIVTYSDGFPSIWPLRVGIYTRAIWFLLAAGSWFFALLCIRKYQKNLVLSFARGLKKLYILILSATFLAAGVLLWINQPFVDHGPEEYVEQDFSQYPDIIMADSIDYSLIVNPVEGSLSGKVKYDYSHYTGGGEQKIQLNTGYKVTSVTYAGEKLTYKMPGDAVNGSQSLVLILPKGKSGVLTIEYEGFPSMARFMYPFMVYQSIDKEYISLNDAAIAPVNMTTTGPCTARITMPENLIPFLDYEPMHNFVDNHDGTKTWTTKSASGYLMTFYAADYKTESFLAGDVKIDFAYGKKYEDTVRNNNVQQAIIDVFDYCTKHYGKSQYANGKKGLLLQQISAMAMGGHATEGYCEWFETVLSPDTLNDPQKGANNTEVFIHEMVHQWWRSYGLECKEEELWSNEGLTVYSTYRIVKEKYGALYAKKYYLDKWQEDVDTQNREFYYRHPEYFKKLPKKYRARLNQQNESINWYSRMPLMIKRAEELVGGEEKMDAILQGMYKENSLQNPNSDLFTFQDFLNACNLTKEDLYLE